MQARWISWAAAGGILVVVVGIPMAFASYRNAHIRNVRVVTPNVLYRSGQLSLPGLEQIIEDYGIRTVVSLRDSDNPALPPPDLEEEKWCVSKDIRHVRIAPRKWWPESTELPPAAEQGVNTFLKVMDSPKNHPVLVHCFAGTHRTGAMVAIYRMEYCKWSNSEALAELRGTGYKNLDRELDVLTYLENYVPRWRK